MQNKATYGTNPGTIKKRLRGRPGDQYIEFNVHKMGNSSFDF